MRPLTIVLPYYENAGMLREQQRCWGALSEDVRRQLHVIVVDDGSPRDPAKPHVQVPEGVGSYRLYRILVDVRWNWLCCRNLGMQEAQTEWVLLTDIDHVAPERTLRRLMMDPLDPQVVYRFSRVDAPHQTPYKPHPNSWCMTRAMFIQMGGYDERFSGYYGTDADFRDRLTKIPTNAVTRPCHTVVMRSDPLIRYPREVIPDASTTTYGRKEPQDVEHVQRIRRERERLSTWYPLRVTFPWTREL
jgi:hypothetical protein